MADIKFSCPNCGQHITCDELWGGHQLDCPSCKHPLAVPAATAPQAPEAPAAPRSLVPKPPAAAEPRLAINAGHASAQAGAEAAQRTIPIRNLAPPPPKKKSRAASYSIGAAVVVALGVGGYFGYGWFSRTQNKPTVSTHEAAKNADLGPAGHRASLGTQAGTNSATAPDALPLLPAVWTLDLTQAKIPNGRANGTLAGTNFVPETARIDPQGAAHVLRLLQGQAASPDHEVLVYLHLKPGEKLGGQQLDISQDMNGAGVPQVTKLWKKNPRFAPQYKSFRSGYAMRLELGQPADGAVQGKIYLALPDPEQSVVAGNFKATIITNAPVDATIQAAPVMTPTPSSTSADAQWQARYGVRRGGQ